MNAEQRIKRIWLLPVATLAIGAAALLSSAPAPSASQHALVVPHLAPQASHVATAMPKPQTAKQSDVEQAHDDNHPPTF